MALLSLLTIAVWLFGLVAVVRLFRSRGLLTALKRLLLAAVLVGLGTVLGTLCLLLRSAQTLSGETVVAQVAIHRLSQGTFDLTYTPVARGAGEAHTVRLLGDQWAISGGIVKWHSWLTALGLPSYHRAIRVSGQFSRIGMQRAHRPSVYPLGGGVDWLWEMLSRIAPSLPFIEAAYGSSAYVNAEPDGVYQVSVTPTGYLIKRGRATPAARVPGTR